MIAIETACILYQCARIPMPMLLFVILDPPVPLGITHDTKALKIELTGDGQVPTDR